MICPKCGYETNGNYCSNCGAPLIEAESAGQGFPEDEYTVSEDRVSGREYVEKPGQRQDKPPRQRVSRKRADSGSGVRSSKKEMQKKDARLKKLENELGKLRGHAEESSKSLKRMETGRREYEEPERERRSAQDGAQGRTGDRTRDRNDRTCKTLAAAGTGTVILVSRLMQLVSAVLMAAMTVVMASSFWEHGQTLGDIRYVMEESNYGLALYTGFAGVSLFMGLVWCLWILSRKGAGGGIRMKTYDTGRGFLPFLICAVIIVSTGILILKVPDDATMWRGSFTGVRAALEAVYAHRNGLFFCSGLGAVLSFIRKLLRV